MNYIMTHWTGMLYIFTGINAEWDPTEGPATVKNSTTQSFTMQLYFKDIQCYKRILIV